MNDSTKIQLIQINGVGPKGFLDVKEGTAFPLNFGVSDIRDVSSKSGTFSKSITLVGNKNNASILAYFDINLDAGTFDINKVTNCLVIQNGVVILDNATLQLVSINKKQTQGSHEDSITYTVVVKDTTSNFFKDINNKLLTDLDFSDLNHKYNGTDIIATFNNTINDGYKYLMPHNPSVSADTKFLLQEFTPAIYAKIYLDRIFAESGFGYSWPALSNDDVMFDKLVIPYNGETPSIKDLSDDFLVEVRNNIDTDITVAATAGYNITIPKAKININSVITDGKGSYDSVNSIYNSDIFLILPNSLDYNIDIEWELDIYNYDTVDSSLANGFFNYLPTLYLMDGSTTKKSTDTLYTYSNSAYTTNVIANKLVLTYGAKRYTPGSNIVGGGSTSIKLSTNVTNMDSLTLQMGCDVLAQNAAFWYQWNNFTPSPTRPIIRITNIRVRIEPTLTTLPYEFPVKMNNFIPKQIKQSDFIKSIFTMYNLFAEVDKDNPKVLNLTSRDDYYDAGIVQDWSKKLSKERNQEVTFLPELQSKRLVLSYKEDKDATNVTYVSATNEVYGQMEYEFDNEYVKGKTKQELIFGPSPIYNTNFGAVLPMVNGQAPKTLPRILIDGGSYSCGEYTIENYTGSTVSGTTYPHLSHWDKPVNPTFDINFGVCDFYFRDDNYGSDTNNNLFNLYWRRTMNQINTGKMLTAYFALNEYDIQKMSLSDKIRIDNSWWNINKVIDYDANSTSLTKVELISIDESLKIPFVTKSVVKLVKGSPYIKWGTEELAGRRNRYSNVVLSNYAVNVNGTNNFVDTNVKSAMVFGDNNSIQSNAIVQGSNNIVAPNVTNAMVLGSGITADTNDSVYVPNIIVSSGGTINGTTVETITTNTTYWGSGTGVNSIVALSTTPNIASGQDSLAYGNGTTASGDYSHSEGAYTIASGLYSHSEGSNTNASGDTSHAGGYGAYATMLGEWARTTSGISGVQYGIVDYFKQTTSAAMSEMFIGGVGTKRFLINPGEALRLTCTVVALNFTTGDVKEWKAEGLIKNLGGTTSMVGSSNSSTWADAGMALASFGFAASNINDALLLEVVGLAGNTIDWYAKVEYIRVY